jgi:hypothetical protein
METIIENIEKNKTEIKYLEVNSTSFNNRIDLLNDNKKTIIDNENFLDQQIKQINDQANRIKNEKKNNNLIYQINNNQTLKISITERYSHIMCNISILSLLLLS